MRRRVLVVVKVSALLALVWAIGGCSALAQLEGGLLGNTDDDDLGGAVHLYMGAGEGPVGMSFGLRTKFAPGVTQFAISTDAYALIETDSPVIPFGRAGVNALQFEDVGGFAFGMFSPYAQLGLLVLTQMSLKQGGAFVSVSGLADYAVRFTEQPNQFHWGVLVGLGFAGITD